jgi:hypothetical protein
MVYPRDDNLDKLLYPIKHALVSNQNLIRMKRDIDSAGVSVPVGFADLATMLTKEYESDPGIALYEIHHRTNGSRIAAMVRHIDDAVLAQIRAEDAQHKSLKADAHFGHLAGVFLNNASDRAYGAALDTQNNAWTTVVSGNPSIERIDMFRPGIPGIEKELTARKI